MEARENLFKRMWIHLRNVNNVAPEGGSEAEVISTRFNKIKCKEELHPTVKQLV